MKNKLRLKLFRIARVALASLAVLGASLAAEARLSGGRSWIFAGDDARLFAQATIEESKPAPVPTPTAAGSTSASAKPGSKTGDVSEAEDEPVTSFDDTETPEPLLCEFSWEKKEGTKSFAWINSGSDYPRLVPPFTKREVLSPAFTRSKTDRGPSWGTCSEVDESPNAGEIIVVLYAHAAKIKTVPEGGNTRCDWVAEGKVLRGSARLKIRAASWAGIEFQTAEGQKKRFSAHWPEKSETETDGLFCRKFAVDMNAKPAIGRSFQKLNLVAHAPSASKKP